MNNAVYLMANYRQGTLYVGATRHLIKRVYQHRAASVPGFTSKYGLKKLVWFELFDEFQDAFEYERTLKNWKREWKIALIEKENPQWRDLFDELIG